MKPRVKSLWILILGVMLLPVGSVFADTGPKPSMEFQFKFEAGVEASTIVSGILFECNQADCSDAEPLAELGPQGLYCETESCRALGYGFAPYHILEIEFSDGVTRRSNIFETEGFDSFYTVYVRQDGLRVESRINPLSPPLWLIVAVACACVLFVGLIIGAIVFLRRRQGRLAGT